MANTGRYIPGAPNGGLLPHAAADLRPPPLQALLASLPLQMPAEPPILAPCRAAGAHSYPRHVSGGGVRQRGRRCSQAARRHYDLRAAVLPLGCGGRAGGDPLASHVLLAVLLHCLWC